jgi:hypothetical protein
MLRAYRPDKNQPSILDRSWVIPPRSERKEADARRLCRGASLSMTKGRARERFACSAVLERVLALVTDIDQLSVAISHATAPAFMLGAVAAFLSILIARLERIADKNKAIRSADPDVDPDGVVAASFARRMELLSRAIYLAVLSAFLTAALLICAFLAALVGIGHGQIVAMMFTLALLLLMASLLQLAREIRVYMKHMHLE